MGDFVVKQESELDSKYGGAFKLVRHSLGISSFGVGVIELPPNADGYPEHDHSGDGQEELYTALAGSGEIVIEDEAVTLEPGVWVAVPAGTKRKITTAEQPLKLLAIGATPGQPYEIPEFSKPDLGA